MTYQSVEEPNKTSPIVVQPHPELENASTAETFSTPTIDKVVQLLAGISKSSPPIETVLVRLRSISDEADAELVTRWVSVSSDLSSILAEKELGGGRLEPVFHLAGSAAFILDFAKHDQLLCDRFLQYFEKTGNLDDGSEDTCVNIISDQLLADSPQTADLVTKLTSRALDLKESSFVGGYLAGPWQLASEYKANNFKEKFGDFFNSLFGRQAPEVFQLVLKDFDPHLNGDQNRFIKMLEKVGAIEPTPETDKNSDLRSQYQSIDVALGSLDEASRLGPLEDFLSSLDGSRPLRVDAALYLVQKMPKNIDKGTDYSSSGGISEKMQEFGEGDGLWLKFEPSELKVLWLVADKLERTKDAEKLKALQASISTVLPQTRGWIETRRPYNQAFAAYLSRLIAQKFINN